MAEISDDPDDVLTFGEQLKVLRDSLGFTQNEWARLLGTDGATVSKWETDVNRPSRSYQRAIESLPQVNWRSGTLFQALVDGRQLPPPGGQMSGEGADAGTLGERALLQLALVELQRRSVGQEQQIADLLHQLTEQAQEIVALRQQSERQERQTVDLLLRVDRLEQQRATRAEGVSPRPRKQRG